MHYNPIKLKDKALFERFSRVGTRELSAHSFANIFIWKGLFNIFWSIINNSLCIFFQDKIGTFLYLPPLGERCSTGTIRQCFSIMDALNSNKDVSRIENIPEKEAGFYRSLGYECACKGNEYVYRRENLAALKGDSFKPKRALFNYFIKHYSYDYRPYVPSYKEDCLALYEIWMSGRRKKSTDIIYSLMLEDSRSVLKVALPNYNKLGLRGRVVIISRRVRGYTFGFELNKETFCILFEIADLTVKGLPQFIFRKFSEELNGYSYINAMDDSGLENLRRVKLSYRPSRLVPSYIARRKNGA